MKLIFEEVLAFLRLLIGMEAVPHAETAARAVTVQNSIAYTKIKPMRFTHDQ